MSSKSGIYKITCASNNKIYVGSAVCLNKRKWRHLSNLRLNIHDNIYLQRAFIKYGEQNFKFEVIETCERENLIKREQHYLDTLLFAQEYILQNDNRFNTLGFNINPIAASVLGCKWTDEQKHNHSKRFVGRKVSLEVKMKISKGNTGKTKSEAHLKALSLAKLGSTLSENHKQHISDSLKGKGGSAHPMFGKPSNARKLIIGLNLNSGVFIEFISLREASLALNAKSPNIIRCMRKNKPYKNHLFFYESAA